MALNYIYIKPHGTKSVTLPRISRENSKDWPVVDRFCHGNLHPVLYQQKKNPAVTKYLYPKVYSIYTKRFNNIKTYKIYS